MDIIDGGGAACTTGTPPGNDPEMLIIVPDSRYNYLSWNTTNQITAGTRQPLQPCVYLLLWAVRTDETGTGRSWTTSDVSNGAINTLVLIISLLVVPGQKEFSLQQMKIIKIW